MGIFDKINPFKKEPLNQAIEEAIKEDNIVSFVNLDEDRKWEAYFYPSTYDPDRGFGVMKNLKGVKDDDVLMIYENLSVISNLHKLNELKKEISIQHLKDIHKTLFQDIYSWAGEFRQVNMAKGNSRFLHYTKIEQNLEPIMQAFKNLDSVKDNQDVFSDRLCQIYLKLNDIHAFREGNGRTQNTFIKHVCEIHGYSLDLQKLMGDMKKNRVNYYSLFQEYNRTQDHTLIRQFLFDPHLVKHSEKHALAKAFNDTYKQLKENANKKTDYINKNSLKM